MGGAFVRINAGDIVEVRGSSLLGGRTVDPGRFRAVPLAPGIASGAKHQGHSTMRPKGWPSSEWRWAAAASDSGNVLAIGIDITACTRTAFH